MRKFCKGFIGGIKSKNSARGRVGMSISERVGGRSASANNGIRVCVTRRVVDRGVRLPIAAPCARGPKGP